MCGGDDEFLKVISIVTSPKSLVTVTVLPDTVIPAAGFAAMLSEYD